MNVSPVLGHRDVAVPRSGFFSSVVLLSSSKWAGWTHSFQHLSPKRILTEGDLGESAPRQVVASSGPWFSSKEGYLGHGTQLVQTRSSAEAGERRLGKKILDNAFNLIHSLESLKCILPWTLKFLSWNNQSNKIFPLRKQWEHSLWCVQNPRPVETLPPCVSG